MLDKNTSGHWNIQARAFKIPCTPFTHNYWALAGACGAIVDQLHGLAFDPQTGSIKAIGNASHLLLAVHDASITWSLQPNQPAVICAAGNENTIRERWQSALNALPAINALKLRYPNLWQHSYKKNSNTIFNTLGQIMGFANPALLLPTFSPGIKLVISEEIIGKYRIQL